MNAKKPKDSKDVDYSSLFGDEKSDGEKIQSLGVLLEKIHSDVKTSMEVSISTRTSLQTQIEDFKCWTKGKFDTVESAIKCNAEGIRHNAEGIKELKSEVQENRKAIERVEIKVVNVTAKLDDHDERITNLENTHI